MAHKKTAGVITFLLVLGIVIFVNVAGFIIELISNLGFLKDNPVQIRVSPVPILIISLVYIVTGMLLWIYAVKEKPRIIILWHIFVGLAVLLNTYKIIYPTYLVKLIPFYAVFSSVLLIAVWAVVFYWLKRKNFQMVISPN